MKDTETLIADLAGPNLTPAKPVGLCRYVSFWTLGLTLYVAAVFIFGILRLRPDLAAFASQPFFMAEIAALVLLAFSTIIASAVLAYPDLYRHAYLAHAPWIGLVLFIGVLVLSWLHSANTVALTWQGFECLSCITLLSLLPAAGMLYGIKRMATVVPDQAGMTAALCAFSVGALILRLSEQTDSIPHVVVWHYLPMLVVAMLGLWLGPKLLRW